uniref:Uncharacterized protein n=1 Tax=Trichogramma kaykai TaxID=54128 RepID=A0ABD2VSL9_9HYME
MDHSLRLPAHFSTLDAQRADNSLSHGDRNSSPNQSLCWIKFPVTAYTATRLINSLPFIEYPRQPPRAFKRLVRAHLFKLDVHDWKQRCTMEHLKYEPQSLRNLLPPCEPSFLSTANRAGQTTMISELSTSSLFLNMYIKIVKLFFLEL